MPTFNLRIACQRCGEQMEMKDPTPDGPWRADQFWVCPRCGRHFWSTYATPPVAATPAGPSQTAGATGKDPA
jgi:transposase-like protein